MTATEASAGGQDRAPSAGSERLPVLLLCALYVIGVLVYTLLGRGQPIPQVSPDEFTYSTLARSLADGKGLTWNGGSENLRAALWVYVITPAWMFTKSTTDSYAIAKTIGAITSTLVVFPTWLLARRYLPPLVALLPALLAVAGSWMTSAGQLLTENLAYPTGAAALAALVFALLRPGSRWGWIALGFALLSAWARLQMGVLVPIILIALAIDAAACGNGWRARARQNAWLLGVTGIVTAASLAVAIGSPSSLGFYSTVVNDTSIGRVPDFVGKQLVAFIAMTGVLPFILAAAVSLRRDAWRDPALRALLIVCWTAIAVFVLQTGYTLPRLGGVTWAIQRYVQYPLPLVFVVAIVAVHRGLLDTRRLAAATIAVAAALLFTQNIRNIQEEHGSFGFARLADNLFGTTPAVALAATAIIAGLIIALVMRSGEGSAAARSLLVTAMLITAVVFGIQDQATWHWQRQQSQVGREVLPADLQWIDHAAAAPVARLLGVYNSPASSEQTEFFNRNVQQVYVPQRPVAGKPVRGKTCPWGPNATGVATFGTGCGPTPSRFLLNDDLTKVTFYAQRVLAAAKGSRVVAVDSPPPSRPRLKAIITPPCTAPFKTQDPSTGEIQPRVAGCGSQTAGQLWLDRPGRVVLRFAGGVTPQQVQVATSSAPSPRIYDIPANRVTQIPLSFVAGASQYQAAFSWPGGPQRAADPRLTGVTLIQNGKREELLY